MKTCSRAVMALVLGAVPVAAQQFDVTGSLPGPLHLSQSLQVAPPFLQPYTLSVTIPSGPFTIQGVTSGTLGLVGPHGGWSKVDYAWGNDAQGDFVLSVLAGANAPAPYAAQFPYNSEARVLGDLLFHVWDGAGLDYGVQIVVDAFEATHMMYANAAVDVGNDGSVECAVLCPGMCFPPVHSAALQVHAPDTDIRVHLDFLALGDCSGAMEHALVQLRFSRRLAAEAEVTGVGCSGAGLSPQMGTQGGALPRLGMTVPIQVQGLPVATPTPVACLVGVDDSMAYGLPLPLDLAPLGMPGCMQYLDPLLEFTTVIASANGVATWNLFLPNVDPLLGFEFLVQSLVPAPGANPAGLLTSDLLRLRVGI